MASSESEMRAIGELFERMSKGRTKESAMAGSLLETRQSDIIISTALKAGTTWMQQICHQLRSGGDTDFGEIGDVVPFLEMAQDLHMDVNDEQKWEPRLFKTHFWEPMTPKGCRYIVVARHPYDMCISFFYFLAGWYFDPSDISIDAFMQEAFLKLGEPRDVAEFASLFHHFASWWPRRNEPGVLWLFYDDMKEDLEGQVKRVAAFLGVDDAETIAMATERSTFAYMKEHAGQFDEKRAKQIRNPCAGLPVTAGEGVGKVRVGGGQRHLLSDATKAMIDSLWERICQPVLGAKDYDDWRCSWHKEIDRLRTAEH